MFPDDMSEEEVVAVIKKQREEYKKYSDEKFLLESLLNINPSHDDFTKVIYYTEVVQWGFSERARDATLRLRELFTLTCLSGRKELEPTAWSIARTYASIVGPLEEIYSFLEEGLQMKSPFIDTRQVTLQRVAYIFHAAPYDIKVPYRQGTFAPPSQLLEKIYDVACSQLHSDFFKTGESSALAMNAVVALGVLGSKKFLSCLSEYIIKAENKHIDRQTARKIKETLDNWEEYKEHPIYKTLSEGHSRLLSAMENKQK